MTRRRRPAPGRSHEGRPERPLPAREPEARGYWLSGRQAVAAALRRGQVHRMVVADGVRGWEEPLRLAAQAGVELRRAPRASVDALAGREAQGVAAWVSPVPAVELEDLLSRAGERALVVVCDHLQDARNLGAIVRTAEAVGALGLVVPDRRAAGLSGVAERAAAGALRSLPCVATHNLTWALDRLRRAGFWVYGTAPAGEVVDYRRADFAARSALVVGAEDHGLSPLVRRHCDRLLGVPMAGATPSLNVAVAAGILMYEWGRDTLPGAERPLTS